jgi:hypothetical protein
MRARTLGQMLFVVSAIALTPAVGRAQEAETPPPHVRGATPETRGLVRELVERSQTGRELVERLEQADIVVYVRQEWFPTSTLRGRIGFLTSTPGPRRMLVIELACRYTRLDQLSALGHELRHAVEIAESPSVHDVRSLAVFYRSIGEPMGHIAASETYETSAAAATGRRVHNELVGAPVAADADDDRN